MKRYITDFGSWFGVVVTFLVCIFAIVIFTFAIFRKYSGIDDTYKTFTSLTPHDLIVDVGSEGFLTSIEITQSNLGDTSSYFDKGAPLYSKIT